MNVNDDKNALDSESDDESYDESYDESDDQYSDDESSDYMDEDGNERPWQLTALELNCTCKRFNSSPRETMYTSDMLATVRYNHGSPFMLRFTVCMCVLYVRQLLR